MIAAIWNRRGIVLATPCSETFTTARRNENDELCLTHVQMEGLPHVITLWERYAVIHKSASTFVPDDNFIASVERTAARWTECPPIEEFMSWLLKDVSDSQSEAIAIVAGYDRDKSGEVRQYIYQVLGRDMRRINLDDKGKPISQWILLEPEPMVNRMFQDVKLRNGDTWEEYRPLVLDLDLFSVRKMEEFCRFLIVTSRYMETLHNYHRTFDVPCETVRVLPGKIEIINDSE